MQSASAAGVSLYNGKYSVWNGSASVTGSLFDLPAGTVKAAVGLDWRREGYEFTGDTRVDQETIYSAPFDNGNALDGVHRTVKAAYAEVLIPIIKGMEVDAAGRIDDYSGFGTTTNPKVSIKYRPWQPIMFRASYSTAFRVPSFNQLFNASYESVYTGADYADPAKCAGGVVNVAAGCPALSSTNGNTFSVKYGGRTDLGPETADEWGAGVVLQPANNISFSADWWLIKRKNTIQTLALQYLFTNYDLFKDQFHYDANGNLTLVDDTYVNTGGTTTQGIDFTFHGAWPIGAHGQVDVGLDGTWLLEKKEKVAAGSASIDELGVYSLADDLGLRWKHNAYVSYSTSDWSVTLTQIFRSGYKNQVLPGVAAGTFDPCCDVTNVKPYILYNLSASYTGIDHLRLTAGITNLFNTDPPFAISYDSNYGSGSDWEPRVADPRGRSFNITASVTL
ncbi:TonB-dependent receptor domain-containing protein [Novosphingobium sp. 9]|uniref:TonB-dependent receptor domain-containing protein n=1 Tax=Novosphingobium sp. 9 TaxID=2025349 RepID=UPI0021B51A5F|nr:TonB-dependent receptor [Novosphingobium sp. 9]